MGGEVSEGLAALAEAIDEERTSIAVVIGTHPESESDASAATHDGP